MRKKILISTLILVLGLFIAVMWPKSSILTHDERIVGYYTGLGIKGREDTIFGKKYYKVVIKNEHFDLRVKYDTMGYNDFKRFYPDGSLAEQGQCMVTQYSYEPIPDDSDLLWSKCYKPDGTLDSEVKNGTGIKIIRDANGVKKWELQLADFAPARRTAWHSNGQLREIVTYYKGEKQGPYTSYYPSGKKKTQGQYSKGQETGTWTWYNEDGTINKTRDY